MARQYNKKSDYWTRLKAPQSQTSVPMSQPLVEPRLLGEPFYKETAMASYSRSTNGGENVIKTRIPRNGTQEIIGRYSLISQGLLPFEYTKDGVDVRDSIMLCQKAYANVAVVRNTIDIATEFANTDIYLEGGTERSREFFTKWFNKIKLWKLKDQYFREYYRSGNIFLYRIDGKFNAEDFRLLSGLSESGIQNNKVPIRYVLINPYEVVAKISSSFAEAVYEKVLSEYELERLKNPKNDEDLELLAGFPPDVQEQIKKKQYFRDGLKMKLDPTFLMYSFYKKQDYEPFSIPFAYPVLDDINAKMELKKIDQAIARTVENVILLITMGAEPDKGGINPANMTAMQNLFMNESVGRVLVSDYTTRADFVIPDLKKVVGEEKYRILNQDIKEGLMNVMLGDDKYAGQTAKIGFFMERLKEARNAFLNDVLQPEIIRISKDLGFRSYPVAKFTEIDSKDETQYMRVVSRLMETGIIAPEQGIEAIKTGKLPEAADLEAAQKKLYEDRKKGYYNPIVGGIPVMPDGEEESAPAPVTRTSQPTNSGPGRPPVATASKKDIKSTVYEIDTFMRASESFATEKFGVDKLNDQQKQSVNELCKKIVASSSREDWTTNLRKCIANFEEIESLHPLQQVMDTADEFLLDEYSAAILFHSAVK
jgi:hypothetical protein